MAFNWIKKYSVQVNYVTREHGNNLIHLTIDRRDGKEIRATWSEIQAIKNDLLGEDVFLYEIYPPESQVVNEINRRHFWGAPFLMELWKHL